jgi:membrane-associated protease RseP (regulator of RpoE activity)
MKKVLVVLLMGVTLLAGCHRVAPTPTPTSPEDIARTFIEASDSGDVATCLSLLSNDIVFSEDPPGVKLEGKDQYEAALKEAILWHEKHSVTSSYNVAGDKVTFTAKLSGDDFAVMGMDYLNCSYELQISDGTISSIIDTPDSADWARLVQLNSGGIGVQLSFIDKGARVDKVATGSPADEAGIKAGDIITAVDGVSYSQMREGEMQLRLQGRLGSKVLLTVIRAGVSAPLDIEVTRA